jgi:hypothetical protein
VYTSKYQKATYEVDSDDLLINLPEPIQAGKSGSYFLYIRAFGLAKKTLLGTYSYKFESFKTHDPIQSLQVGISTDPDFYLKGATGTVNYKYTDTAAFNAMGGVSSVESPSPNAQLDNYYQSIGRGNLYKNATNLAADESFTLKGTYASSRLMLYTQEITIGLISFIAIILAFIFLYRFIKNRIAQKAVKEENVHLNSTALNLLVSGLIGFGSSLSIALYTVAAVFISSGISRLFSTIGVFAALLFIVISFAIYLLLFVAPSIYMGWKKGIKWGVWTALFTIVWLIVFFLALALFVNFIMGFESTIMRPIY